MNELALFAGGGGGLLASRLLGWRTVCYVERDHFCVSLLKQRITDGYLDDAPIWDDCFTFDGHPWAGYVDIITAGFPCQPFSIAGRMLSDTDPRNGWPAIQRILGEVRPLFAFLENVPGLISKPYIRRIFGDLAALGYDAEWAIVSAAYVGSPHLRKRLWIIAYTPGLQEQLQLFPRQDNIQPARDGQVRQVADIHNPGSNRLEEQRNIQTNFITKSDWWSIEPGMDRVANGLANRVDRLRTLGNGQVPAVAESAWYLLTERAFHFASPALSSLDASHSPAQEGDAHPAPLEGPTNKAE